MDKHTQDLLWVCWQVWMWVAAIGWPFAAMRTRKLTDAERWEVFHELVAQPQLMADGKTLQRIDWKYVAVDPAGADAQVRQSAPTIRLGGRVQA